MPNGRLLSWSALTSSENPRSKVKKQSGGDTTAMSAKQAPSETFNHSKWLPDMRVYEGVPKKGDAEYMEKEQEELYVDKLWLCAIVRSQSALSRVHAAHVYACAPSRFPCALDRRRTPSPLLASTSLTAWLRVLPLVLHSTAEITRGDLQALA